MNHSAPERVKIRLKSLYLYLKEKGCAVSTKELAEEFGCPMRTIQRDLKVLEYNGLVRCQVRGKWIVCDKHSLI